LQLVRYMVAVSRLSEQLHDFLRVLVLLFSVSDAWPRQPRPTGDQQRNTRNSIRRRQATPEEIVTGTQAVNQLFMNTL